MRIQYLSEIDGIRAIAVLAVIIFHLNNSFLPGGFTGVDIFFVISGFVVTKSLCDKNLNKDTSIKDYFLNFYSSRFLRILPPLFFMLIIVFTLFILLIPASWLSGTSEKTGLFAFFGFSNFILINFNDGYFSPRNDFNPFTHTWSLGVEEQFYLIFPSIILLYILSKGGNIKKISTLLILFLITITSIYYAYFLYENNENLKSYFSIFSRFWEFSLGVLTYLCFSEKISKNKIFILRLLGILIISIGLIYSDSNSFPYPWAFVPVIGTIFLLLSVSKENKSFLNNRILSFIGKLSYSLYLWHWPIFVLMRWTIGLDSFSKYFFSLLLTFIMAYISYIFIENPIRFNKFLVKNKFLVLSLGIIMMGSGCFYANYIIENRSKISLSITKETHDWYPYPYPINNEVMNKKFEAKTVFLIGNSHSGAYEGMVHELSTRTGANYKIFGDVCSFGNLLYLQDKSKECNEKIETALTEIEKTGKPGDVILFASLRVPRVSDQWGQFDKKAAYESTRSDQSLSRIDQARVEFLPIVKRLQKFGFNIVIDTPKPIFEYPIYRCSDSFNKMNPVCKKDNEISRNYLINQRAPIVNSLNKIDGIYIWDTFDILCPKNQKKCLPYDIKNGKPLFFDGDHLSGYGNRFLYPSFYLLMNKIWSKKE